MRNTKKNKKTCFIQNRVPDSVCILAEKFCKKLKKATLERVWPYDLDFPQEITYGG